MAVFIELDRLEKLEASQFRTNNALAAISSDINQIKGALGDSRMDEKLDNVLQRQAQLIEVQAEQSAQFALLATQVKQMASQLNSIEKLLSQLVTQQAQQPPRATTPRKPRKPRKPRANTIVDSTLDTLEMSTGE